MYTCDKLPPPGEISTFLMSKTKLLNIRIEPDLKKKAKKLAEADGRSLSNWVTKLISAKVKEAERKNEKSEDD